MRAGHKRSGVEAAVLSRSPRTGGLSARVDTRHGTAIPSTARASPSLRREPDIRRPGVDRLRRAARS
jgi:hypothetical protein